MIKNVSYRYVDGAEQNGAIEYSELGSDEVLLKFHGTSVFDSVRGDNFFDALSKLRLRLEGRNLRIICNGSSLNVYPSGMALNMGNGEMVYRLREGFHPTSSDLVNIFDLERDLYQESTVKEQKDFFDRWNKSSRKSKYAKPIYTVESVRIDDEFLFFWGQQRAKDGIITKSCLSQWWPCDFEKDGVVYSSAEQWMMAEKARAFLDEEILKMILGTRDPKEAKEYGRQVSNFNEDVWSLKCFSIVKEGNFLKFSQNPGLRDYLLSTGDSVLVEASPYDPIWGIGMKQGDAGIEDPSNWKGKNLLGFALMEVRDILSKMIAPNT